MSLPRLFLQRPCLYLIHSNRCKINNDCSEGRWCDNRGLITKQRNTAKDCYLHQCWDARFPCWNNGGNDTLAATSAAAYTSSEDCLSHQICKDVACTSTPCKTIFDRPHTKVCNHESKQYQTYAASRISSLVIRSARVSASCWYP